MLRATRFVPLLSLAVASLCASLSLGGCKKKSAADSCKPDDYTFEEIAVHIQALGDLNLDDEGNPLPVLVRLYQMSGDLAVRNLDFTELWQDAETALGDEFISVKEFEIYPDSNEMLEITPEGDARYLLAFAVFRQPVGNTWYRLYEIPDNYGRQACDLAAEEKDPASLGQPCAYLLLERNAIDGGERVPPGFDESKLEVSCAPVYVAPRSASPEDEAADDPS